MNVSKLEIVPVRDAFSHEAHNFTVWLEDNIDALGDRLNLRLSVVEREKSVGSFNVDLFCEDTSGSYIIIENQLERSDHDHLGKVLTYLVNLEASAAVWVTPDPRPEHQRVIDWLNESTGTEYAFYLVKVEAVRIGNSPYAPLFTVLAAPDEQTREIGETKKKLAERKIEQQREAFWTQLLEKARQHTNFTNISPSRYHYIALGAGKSGVTFNFSVGTDWAHVDLYIDFDKDTGDGNKIIYDALYDQKIEIESDIGKELDWRRLDDKRASRIILRPDIVGGLKTPDVWEVLQYELVEMMRRFDASIRPRLKRINV